MKRPSEIERTFIAIRRKTKAVAKKKAKKLGMYDIDFMDFAVASAKVDK